MDFQGKAPNGTGPFANTSLACVWPALGSLAGVGRLTGGRLWHCCMIKAPGLQHATESLGEKCGIPAATSALQHLLAGRCPFFGLAG